MAVDSIQKTPLTQIQQGADTREQSERFRQSKKGASQKEEKPPKPAGASENDEPGDPASTLRQILDSGKTIELLQASPIEAKTLRTHALKEMTRKESVKKSASDRRNKLNKSA